MTIQSQIRFLFGRKVTVKGKTFLILFVEGNKKRKCFGVST